MDYPLVVGNWKMNLEFSEALVLSGQISKNVERIRHLDVVLCPPSTYLYPIWEFLRSKPRNLYFGTQNIMWEAQGQYTGEISAEMIRGVGRFAIIGHSERRKIFGETDEMVAKKTTFALKNNITPIVCVGEKEKFNFEDRFKAEVVRMAKEGGILFEIDKALKGVSGGDLKNIAIAYEPIWAIGTGNAATGAYAAAVCYIIRDHLAKKYSQDIAQSARVLYGGSVSSKNVREYMLQPSIDGLLVGSSSIHANEFIKICQISSEVKSGRAI